MTGALTSVLDRSATLLDAGESAKLTYVPVPYFLTTCKICALISGVMAILSCPLTRTKLHRSKIPSGAPCEYHKNTHNIFLLLLLSLYPFMAVFPPSPLPPPPPPPPSAQHTHTLTNIRGELLLIFGRQ